MQSHLASSACVDCLLLLRQAGRRKQLVILYNQDFRILVGFFALGVASLYAKPGFSSDCCGGLSAPAYAVTGATVPKHFCISSSAPEGGPKQASDNSPQGAFFDWVRISFFPLRLALALSCEARRQHSQA